MKIYVAGALDSDPFGIDRRRRVKVIAKLTAMGHEVLDPVDANYEVDEVLRNLKPMKGTNEYSSYVGLIVVNDLRLVSEADVIFVIYSRGVRKGAGTHGEITHAAYLMKPVIIWSPWHRMKKIPGWIFGCCHPKFMFKNLKDALRSINIWVELKAQVAAQEERNPTI